MILIPNSYFKVLISVGGDILFRPRFCIRTVDISVYAKSVSLDFLYILCRIRHRMKCVFNNSLSAECLMHNQCLYRRRWVISSDCIKKNINGEKKCLFTNELLFNVVVYYRKQTEYIFDFASVPTNRLLYCGSSMFVNVDDEV